MITKQDSLKLQKDFRKIFVTKLEMNARFDVMEEKIDAFKTEIRGIVLTSHDEIMGEIRAMRDEMAAYSFRQREHSDQLEGHEIRITGLESKIS